MEALELTRVDPVGKAWVVKPVPNPGFLSHPFLLSKMHFYSLFFEGRFYLEEKPGKRFPAWKEMCNSLEDLSVETES